MRSQRISQLKGFMGVWCTVSCELREHCFLIPFSQHLAEGLLLHLEKQVS